MAAQLVVRPQVQELEQQGLRISQVTKVKARWDISASLLAGLGQVGTSRRSELTEGEMSKRDPDFNHAIWTMIYFSRAGSWHVLLRFS
jgi:hypothetical protein